MEKSFQTEREVVYLNKEINYLINCPGVKVRVVKWWKDDSLSGDYDTGYEIDEKDTKDFTDEEYEELEDYVLTLR